MGSQDFVHVIAVDEAFSLFGRVWCLAEIAEAHDLRSKQRCVVCNRESVDREYSKLRVLDVRDSEASRPEDKADILARIPDLDVFSEKLQEIAFGTDGLVWNRMDTRDKFMHIG